MILVQQRKSVLWKNLCSQCQLSNWRLRKADIGHEDGRGLSRPVSTINLSRSHTKISWEASTKYVLFPTYQQIFKYLNKDSIYVIGTYYYRLCQRWCYVLIKSLFVFILGIKLDHIFQTPWNLVHHMTEFWPKECGQK
jgi:hypothetical protein